MKKVSFLLPLLAVVLFAFAPGKKSGFEGKIVYSISYEDLPEEYEAYASMLPKEMTMYISDDKARIEQSTGMGTNVTIVDKTKKEIVILMDMMGMKTAYKGSTEEKSNEEKATPPEFKYVEGTKEIAGYTCKKAIMTVKDEEPAEIWYTEDLPAGLSRGMDGLNGFPLEYTVSKSGMVLKMTVTTISTEKVPATYFTVPDGYEMKSMDDLRSMGK